MSYMSPSYLIQSQFDTSWTPLAKRYSLLLYREVGWEDDEVSFVFVLLVLTNNQVASRGPSPLHPRKCWVCSPDPFNSLLGHTTILSVSVHPFTRVYLTWHQTPRLLRRCVPSLSCLHCSDFSVPKSSITKTFPHSTDLRWMSKESTPPAPYPTYFLYTQKVHLSSSWVIPWGALLRHLSSRLRTFLPSSPCRLLTKFRPPDLTAASLPSMSTTRLRSQPPIHLYYRCAAAQQTLWFHPNTVSYPTSPTGIFIDGQSLVVLLRGAGLV